jgi:hypothetical protein
MPRITIDLIGLEPRRTAQRRIGVRGGLLLTCMLALHSTAMAQSPRSDDARPSAVVEIAKQVVTDPTTYVPASVLYTSMQLDWNSSQPLFQRGYVEQNARYTQSGLSRDLPLSYANGNRKLVMDSLAVLPLSIANNALDRIIERRLTERFPHKRRLWKTFGWAERVAFASYTAYLLSNPHFEQWQKNQQMANALGR